MMDFKDFAIVGCVCGIAYLIFENQKSKDNYEKIVDKIAEGIDVNIDDAMIEKAVEKAVEKEAGIQVNKACIKAVDAIRDDISAKVSKAVKEEENSLKDNTKKEIERKISKIDITKARDEVIRQAQDIVADRLEEDTKAIAKTYETSIKNVADLCEKMISTATISAQEVRQPIKTNGSETVIQLFKEVL